MKSLTPEEAAAAAKRAAKGFHLLRTIGRHDWSFHPAFPVRMFLERPVGAFVKSSRGRISPASPEDWMLFYEQERHRNPHYYDALSAAWKVSPEALGPVIVAFLPDGRLDVADGWHRVALSIMLGMEAIPAIMGIPRRRPSVDG